MPSPHGHCSRDPILAPDLWAAAIFSAANKNKRWLADEWQTRYEQITSEILRPRVLENVTSS